MNSTKKYITTPVSPEMWERVRIAAFKARVSRAEWCRRAIAEKIERDANLDEEIFRE